MNNKHLSWILVMFLLVSFSSAAQLETAYERAAVSRIAADSAAEMKDMLSTDKIDIKHSVFYSDTYEGSYYIYKREMLDGYTEENSLSPSTATMLTQSTGDWQKNEFLLVEGGNIYTQEAINKNYFSEAFSQNNPLMVLNTNDDNLHYPEEDSPVNKFGQDSVILTTSKYSDFEFTEALLCNLGHFADKSIGELVTQVRNRYYHFSPNKATGLNLMSFNLFGDGSATYTIPEKYPGHYETITFMDPRHPGFIACQQQTMQPICEPYNIWVHDLPQHCYKYILDDYPDFSYQDDPFYINSAPDDYTTSTISKFKTSETAGEQTLTFTLDFSNYSLEQNGDFELLQIDGNSLVHELNQLVLPTKTTPAEFPLKTVITEIQIDSMDNPVELSISSLPTYAEEYVNRTCLEEINEPGISYVHTHSPESELIFVKANPIEIINCTTGEIRLYQTINYHINYIPYSPVFLKIDPPDMTTPGKTETLKVILENTEPTTVTGTLELKLGAETIKSIDVDSANPIYEINFAAPSKIGIYEYTLEFIKDNESLTSVSFLLDVGYLDAQLVIPKVVGSSAITPLYWENRYPESYNVLAHYYVKKDGILFYEDETSFTATTDGVVNFEVTGLERSQQYYQVIIDLIYMNQHETITGTIITNHKPELQDIDTIRIYEGDIVTIDASAFDAEGDSLTYSINSDKFTQQTSLFSWQTQAGDSENYTFTITASDGYLDDIAEIKVEVLPAIVEETQPIINSINSIPTTQDITLEIFEGEIKRFNIDSNIAELDSGIFESNNSIITFEGNELIIDASGIALNCEPDKPYSAYELSITPTTYSNTSSFSKQGTYSCSYPNTDWCYGYDYTANSCKAEVEIASTWLRGTSKGCTVNGQPSTCYIGSVTAYLDGLGDKFYMGRDFNGWNDFENMVDCVRDDGSCTIRDSSRVKEVQEGTTITLNTPPSRVTNYAFAAKDFDDCGDAWTWAYYFAGYSDPFTNIYSVNCVDDTDCATGYKCDTRNNWDTWRCVDDPCQPYPCTTYCSGDIKYTPTGCTWGTCSYSTLNCNSYDSYNSYEYYCNGLERRKHQIFNDYTCSGTGCVKVSSNYVNDQLVETCDYECQPTGCVSDPCTGVDTSDKCEGDILKTNGICSDGVVTYDEETCDFGCQDAACLLDPCLGVDTSNHCDGDNLKTNCICNGGTLTCDTTPCAAGCEDAACKPEIEPTCEQEYYIKIILRNGDDTYEKVIKVIIKPANETDPCTGVTCDDYCDSYTHYTGGYCSKGICEYTSIEENSPVCGYTDPCEGITCDDYCDGYTHYSAGTCNNGECIYSSIEYNSTACGWIETDDITEIQGSFTALQGTSQNLYIFDKKVALQETYASHLPGTLDQKPSTTPCGTTTYNYDSYRIWREPINDTAIILHVEGATAGQAGIQGWVEILDNDWYFTELIQGNDDYSGVPAQNWTDKRLDFRKWRTYGYCGCYDCAGLNISMLVQKSATAPDPCLGITCDDHCDGFTYYSDGTCNYGECIYSHIEHNSISCGWEDPICSPEAHASSILGVNSTFRMKVANEAYSSDKDTISYAYGYNIDPGAGPGDDSYVYLNFTNVPTADRNIAFMHESGGDCKGSNYWYCFNIKGWDYLLNDWTEIASYWDIDSYPDFTLNSIKLPNNFVKDNITQLKIGFTHAGTNKVPKVYEMYITGECVDVACYSDEDCGTSDFTGDAFCSDNGDIRRPFRQYSCENPGTQNAVCQFEDSDELIERCDYGCEVDSCYYPDDIKAGFTSYIGTPYDGLFIFDREVELNDIVLAEFGDVNDYVVPWCSAWGCCDLTEYDRFSISRHQITDDIHEIYLTGGAKSSHFIDGFLELGNEWEIVNVMGSPGRKDEGAYFTHNLTYADFRLGLSYTGCACSDCARANLTVTVQRKGTYNTCFYTGCDDYCNKSTLYYDGICMRNGECQYQEKLCNIGCEDNACILPACYSDSDCDDNDEYTLDKCNNAGLADAVCEHTQVACLTDLDCEDRNPYTIASCLNYQCYIDTIECLSDADCNDNNVYTLDECNNPGQIDAVCEHTKISCLIDLDCNDNNPYTVDRCSNYICYNDKVTCIKDSDCDDNQELSIDTCINPGTISAYCENNFINCMTDTDCNDNDDYTKDICINPGSPFSHCENTQLDCISNTECSSYCEGRTRFYNGICSGSCSYSQELCPGNCLDGICVKCLTDADCDDNNDYTKEICSMPGLPSSGCSYKSILCIKDSDCDDNDPSTLDRCMTTNLGYGDIIWCEHEKQNLADLRISELRVQGVKGTNIVIRFNLENAGTVEANNIEYQINTGVKTISNTNKKINLQPGEDIIVYEKLTYPQEGAYSPTIILDPLNKIPEYNEDNNIGTLNIQIE